MKRKDDGSNVNVGNYTLCAVFTSSSNGNSYTYTSVGVVSVIPLLHYSYRGNVFIVNVSSTVYLQGDLNVDKL